MAWQVIDYMDNNPQATPKDVIGYFAEMLEVNEQIENLKDETKKVLIIREVLRPLYGKKMNAESDLALLDSDFEMEVMIKYPPRQGTDKDRKAYKSLLQSRHNDYQKVKDILEQCKEEISLHESEMADVQQKAKNARRLLETFNHYMAFVLNSASAIATMSSIGSTTASNNQDVF
jgi:hypothetical protein